MNKKKQQIPVKIVDAIMGSGKTTGMFKLMDEQYSKTKKKFFYVSLFNSEVGCGNKGVRGRIHEELEHMSFKMPKNKGQRKVGDIKFLIRKGYNIATTHQSFKDLDKEAIDLMVDAGYTLVIDEAMDCISQYKEWSRDELIPLIECGWIKEGDGGKLSWHYGGLGKDSKYAELIKLCNTESLYLFGNEVIIWEYPPLLLKSLDDVYVITYLFKGSIMCSWMQKNNIQYKWLDPEVLGLKTEEEIKNGVRKNLTLMKSNNLKALREEAKGQENQFSVGWYRRNCTKDGSKDYETTGMMERITKIMESCVTRSKVTNKEVFWTTYKEYKKGLAGKGFKQTPRDGQPPFLVYNKKATNDYRDHTLCMYAVNVFKTQTEVDYLKSRGIEFDSDQYSLSEMLQFIFRGSLRSGKPMKLLVLSDRMEKLLKGWLDE